MKNDYRSLKIKIFLQILGVAVVTTMVGLLIKETLIDGVLQKPFANGFVNFCSNVLLMDHEMGIRLYRSIFLQNKGTILTIGYILLLLGFIYGTMSRFIHYFNQISIGIGGLLENTEQPITLRPELQALETKLNLVKKALEERKVAAEESEKRKNDLIVYLAHDLKTPLTSVIAYLNILQESPDLPMEQRAKYTAISLKKAQRLEELINEFFEITRYNLQNIILQKEKILLSFMLEQLVDEFYPTFAEKRNEVVIKVDENVTIYGDSDKLARVFSNILRNATVYSDKDSEIEISAKIENNQVVVAFRNKGKRIPEHKLETIFEKFYRVDESRSSNTGGAGLGLAIAKEIVEQHKGRISAKSDESGTEFIVTLPMEEKPEDPT